MSKNFHTHLKTHNISGKEYKAWQTKNQLARAQPAGGAGGAGFGGGGDDFGGDFDGGFGDQYDRGAQDDRFEDVPDEPAGDGEAKVTLVAALKDKGTRDKLREVEGLWQGGMKRARNAPNEKTKTTYFGQGAAVLVLLSARGRELVARVSLLKADSTAAHVKRFACQVAETLEDLVPIEDWAKKIEKKRAGSTAVGLLMLERLFAWAKVQHETSLAAVLGVGVEPPRSLVLARVFAASLPAVAVKARADSHQGVLAKRAAAQKQTNSWQKATDVLIELAAFKAQCESDLEQMLTAGGADKEKLQELSTEELQTIALLCLVGGSDVTALRVNVGNSLAADAGKAVDHKMTILRQRDGRILLQVVDKQKGHIMAPINISEHAPATAKVLNALLDRQDFVQGGPICRAIDGNESRLIDELRHGADLADFGETPAVLVGVGVKGLPLESNTFRRWYATVGFAAMLWGVISVLEFVGLCYVQQHDPNESIKSYMKLQGLKELAPQNYETKWGEARHEYRQKTTPGANGIVPQEDHAALTRAMWRALVKLRKMCQSIKDRDNFVCPKCCDKPDPADIAQHVAKCLGGLGSDEAGRLLEAQRRERIEAGNESLDESDDGDSTDADGDSDAGDDDNKAGHSVKRKAAVQAGRNIKKITTALSHAIGKTKDDDDSFEVALSGDTEDEGTSENGNTEDSDEPEDEPDDVEQRVAFVPRAALIEFESRAAGIHNEVLALLVKIDGVYKLLFLDQECDRTTCVLTETGDEQLTSIMQRGVSEVIAWVHSHPGHDLFLSHVDVHTQLGWQALAGVFSLVWAPDESEKWAAYYLTDQQMRKTTECEKKNGRAQNDGNNCVGFGEPKNYTKAMMNRTADACEVVERRNED